MPDASRSRKQSRRPALTARRSVRVAAAGVLLLAVALVALLLLRRVAPVDGRQAYADAVAAFGRGNYSAARSNAQRAATAMPAAAAPRLMLARAYLRLGDGLAAEAALSRAQDAGIAASRLHADRAEARFLQGDYDGAREEAAKAPSGDRLATRITARALAVTGQGDLAQPMLTALVARDPSNGEAWIDLGRIRLIGGDVGGASAAAAQALRLRPGDPATATLQGELVRTRYGLIAALPWFAAALKRDAYYHPALIEYAATLGDAGRYTEMLAATRSALAARPGSPQALYLQAVLAARAGRRDLARTLLDRAGSGLPAAALLGGMLAFADGTDEVAIRNWRALFAQQPMNLNVRRLLAAALLRSGDAQGALDTLRAVALRDDADAYTLTLAARGFEATGDRQTAARFLDRAAAARAAPAAPFATDETLAALLAHAAQVPTDPGYVLGVIRGQIAAGNTAGAIQRAQGLAAATPGAPAAYLALGDTLAVAGRYADALAAYTRAADLRFDEPAMLRLIDAQGRAGRPRDAAATLALYLSQNPQSVTARRLLGHWQVANGDVAAGIETLEGVRRIVGNRDTALLADLARGYAATGDGPIARRYGRAAYTLAPINAGVADAYGIALAADGDVAGARQLFAKAAVLDPDDPAITAHRRQIER